MFYERDTAPQPERTKPRARAQHTLWNSEQYFDVRAASNPEYLAALEARLTQDLTSFFDEYSFLRAAVVYEYGPTGMRGGYTQTLSEVTTRFLEHMQQQGRPLARASAEVMASLAIEQWMKQHPHSQKPERIVTISPRGTEAELYPGLDEKNYIFVNVFEKNDTSFFLRQYRSYDPNSQLPNLQERLAATAPDSGYIEQLATDQKLNSDHQTITRVVHVPSSVPLEQIEAAVYTHKEAWPINIDRELPHVPSRLRVHELERTTAYCRSLFHELAQDHALPLHEKKEAFTELIQLVRTALLKWTEDHATNYHESTEEMLQYHLDLDLITQSWRIKLKERTGAELEETEYAVLSQFNQVTQLSNLLPLQEAASWAHCIVGTPQSLLLQSVMNSSGIFTPTSALDFRSFISQMSAQERSRLAESIQSYVQVSVGGEIWYVPASYLAEPGCFYDEESGLVMGPCGVPLKDDPLAYTAEQFAALTAALAEDPEEALELLDQHSQSQIKEVYVWLLHELVVPSAALDTILLGDILKPEDETRHELLSLRTATAQSTNPLAYLLWYCIELYDGEHPEASDVLEHIMQLPAQTNDAHSVHQDPHQTLVLQE